MMVGKIVLLSVESGQVGMHGLICGRVIKNLTDCLQQH